MIGAFVVSILLVAQSAAYAGDAFPSVLEAVRSDWNLACQTAASSKLPRLAEPYRSALLEYLDSEWEDGSSAATLYPLVVEADGLVLRELAGRRSLYDCLRSQASRSGSSGDPCDRCKPNSQLGELRELLSELELVSDSLAFHVPSQPIQRTLDFRDPRLRVEVEPYPELDYTDAFSFSCWINFEGGTRSSETKIVSHSGVSADGKVALLFDRNDKLRIVAHLENGSTAVQQWSFAPELHRWVHILVTFDKSRGFALFANGVPLERSRRSRDVYEICVPVRSNPSQKLYIGGLDRSFPGWIDDLRIFDRSLSHEECLKLLQGDSLTNGLIGHWDMDPIEPASPGQRAHVRNLFAAGHRGTIGEWVVSGPGCPEGSGSGALLFAHADGSWRETMMRLEAKLDAIEETILGRLDRPVAHIASPSGRSSTPCIHYVWTEHDVLAVFDPGVDGDSSDSPGTLAGFRLGSTTQIDSLVDELTAQFEMRSGISPAHEEQYRKLARELASRIWDPFEPHLAKRPGAVDLRLDGSLTRVPFTALVDPSGKYLVERFAFRQKLAVGNGSHSSPGRGNERTVAVGNPSYAGHPRIDSEAPWVDRDTDGTGLRQADCYVAGTHLFGTRIELERLQALFDSAALPIDLLEWDAAYEGTLQSAIADARIVHIATHTYRLETDCLPVSPSDPFLLCGLQMSGLTRVRPERSRFEDDGFLCAQEIARMDLGGTELVGLSGCGTAEGDLILGEGVFGLAAATAVAGAEATLATLFEVRDDAMPDLMLDFYTAFLAGRPMALALREAVDRARQRTLEERGHSHPAYWAAPILSGSQSGG